jgi:hypothetical protein
MEECKEVFLSFHSPCTPAGPKVCSLPREVSSLAGEHMDGQCTGSGIQLSSGCVPLSIRCLPAEHLIQWVDMGIDIAFSTVPVTQ